MSNYLIDFINTASQEEIDLYIASNQCTIIKSYAVFDKVYLVAADVAPPPAAIIERIAVDDQSTAISLLDIVPVEATYPAGTLSVLPDDIKDWWKVYSFNHADLSQTSIEIPVYGEKINVYMVDSGIDISHPEFEGKDVTLLYSINDNFSDSSGHGTALSSLVVGKTCGLTNSSLKVVKIFEKDTPTLQSQLLSAFEAIIQDSLASPNLVSIVNLSWAIPKNEYIENKIRSILASGAAVVCAAGNAGLPISDVTPAGMPDVITVGSYNNNFLPSDFSNYTDPTFTSLTNNLTDYGTLDSWAPGEQIWAAKPNGEYGFTAGTSAAAAIYSASIAYFQSQILSNGNLMSAFRFPDGRIDWNRLFLVDRSGLLNLDDPKYQNSSNRICTYKEFMDLSINPTIPWKSVVSVGSEWTLRIFAEKLTQSYELLDPLPEGATIERNAIRYAPTVDSNPTGIETFIVNFRLFNNDGTVTENYIQFVKLGSQFNKDTLPENDPLIAITTMDFCESATSCNRSCLYGSSCYGTGKYTCACE